MFKATELNESILFLMTALMYAFMTVFCKRSRTTGKHFQTLTESLVIAFQNNDMMEGI